MNDPPFIALMFTYDHVSGLFGAKLPNGATFSFERSEVSGKLSANLELFRRAVIASHEGRSTYRPISSKAAARAEAQALSLGLSPSIFNSRGRPVLDLEDLEIDL